MDIFKAIFVHKPFNMTKTTLLLLWFSACSCLTQAQVFSNPFPTANAQWHAYLYNCSETAYLSYYTCQDTSKDGLTFVQLRKRKITPNSFDTDYGWLRRDAQKVFYRTALDAAEYLLYDFSMLPGDTAHFVRFVGQVGNNLELKSLFFKVQTFDSVQIFGVWRNRWKFYCSDPKFCPETWIESVGSTLGPIDRVYCGENTNLAELQCAVVNGERTYQSPQAFICNEINASECLLSGTHIPISHPAITLYPNPFTDFLHISFQSEIPPATNVQLFDILGRAVEIRLEETAAGFSLERAQMPKGLYFLKIETDKKHGKTQVFKVLAE